MEEFLVRRGIGLFGGTFDPVHNGHLALARAALEELRLARVDFVVAPAPWQKSVLTPIDERIALLEEAVSSEERLHVNLCEVLRGGATYTIDTLREMRSGVGPSTPLVLLLGTDQWRNFHTWRDWPLFFSLVSIAVCNRGRQPFTATPEVTQWAQPHAVPPLELHHAPCGLFTRFAMPEHDASSTRIREVFAQQGQERALKTLERWLPAAVSRRIALRHIY